MLSTHIDILAFTALAFCAFSGSYAAPLNGAQGNSPLMQLVPRSPPRVLTKCPTLAEAIRQSRFTKQQLKDKTLLWHGTPLGSSDEEQIERRDKVAVIAQARGVYSFSDLYPPSHKDAVCEACGWSYYRLNPEPGVLLLSEAMAHLVSGKVLIAAPKGANLDDDIYLRKELGVLEKRASKGESFLIQRVDLENGKDDGEPFHLTAPTWRSWAAGFFKSS